MALDWVNWKICFDWKDINAKVAALNEAILNVFPNYVLSNSVAVYENILYGWIKPLNQN